MKRFLSISVFILSFTVLFTIMPVDVHAAEIFFGAKSDKAVLKERFEIGVFVNTADERFNAVSGTIKVPDSLKFQDMESGGSLINFWVEEPYLKACSGGFCDIIFSGIVPGGFDGGKGYLFSMVVSAVKTGNSVISAENENILLNDGEGTPAQITKAPFTLIISSDSSAPPFTQRFDTDPPEEFTPMIINDPNIFEGAAFIVFSTQDKNSGLDYFEIKEKKFLPVSWARVKSPYRLRDQGLKSTVFVKAVDKARNERVIVIPPRFAPAWYESDIFWVIIIGVALIVSAVWRVLTGKNRGNQ